MGGIRIDRGYKIHAESVRGDAATLCGRGAERVTPMLDEPDCMQCKKIMAKEAARVERMSRHFTDVVKGMQMIQGRYVETVATPEAPVARAEATAENTVSGYRVATYPLRSAGTVEGIPTVRMYETRSAMAREMLTYGLSAQQTRMESGRSFSQGYVVEWGPVVEGSTDTPATVATEALVTEEAQPGRPLCVVCGERYTRREGGSTCTLCRKAEVEAVATPRHTAMAPHPFDRRRESVSVTTLAVVVPWRVNKGKRKGYRR